MKATLEAKLDHVVIAVKDLKAAKYTYHNTLGFTLDVGGKHPIGTQNSRAWFQDETYLELITFLSENNWVLCWKISWRSSKGDLCLH